MPDSSSLLSTEPARAERLLHVLIRYGLLWLLALIVVFFSVAEPAFLRVGNLFSILQSVSIVALLALGVTLTMAVGGLDLSIGAVAAMARTGLELMTRPELLVEIQAEFSAMAP